MVYLSPKSVLLLAQSWRGTVDSLHNFADMNDMDWEMIVMESSSMNKISHVKSLINRSLRNEEQFLAYLNEVFFKDEDFIIDEVNNDLEEQGLVVKLIDNRWKLVKKTETSDNESVESTEPVKIESSYNSESKIKPSIIDVHKLDPKQEKKYFDILKIINDSGKSMETQSSSFGDDEPKLRDQLVTVLRTHLKSMASVTAESLNVQGKTDIMVREGSVNLCIAECKIWSGRKDLAEGLTQLLGYTNWRDPYTAIVIFAKNKKISTILEDVQKEIPEHDSFDDIISIPDKSWFNYKVHLPGDKKIEMRLAVLIFKLS